MGRGGFEPPKAFASRFTVCPLWPLGYLPLKPEKGVEPPTCGLQNRCSSQLSYSGARNYVTCETLDR